MIRKYGEQYAVATQHDVFSQRADLGRMYVRSITAALHFSVDTAAAALASMSSHVV